MFRGVPCSLGRKYFKAASGSGSTGTTTGSHGAMAMSLAMARRSRSTYGDTEYRSSKITIKGMECFGYHGVLESEAKQGQRFVVDVVMTIVGYESAALTDKLDCTVDYGSIVKLVRDDFKHGKRLNLIECLGGRLADSILNLTDQIESVEVTVHKPEAPIQLEGITFQDISATIVKYKKV